MKYKHIFFDLDHTLWDFEASSEFTFKKMYDHFELFSKGISNVEDYYKIIASLYLIVLSLGVIISVTSTYLAVNRYLKIKTSNLYY